MKNLITIVGPTATGKSDLGVFLAERYNGEIISADSRQIYKDLDIGSGKITNGDMKNIMHFGLDIIPLERNFSVSEYKKYTENIMESIYKREKTPLLVGGTGFYIQSIVDDYISPEVPPNADLREKLSHSSLSELQDTLKNLDPKRFESIEKENPRRLIRSIEIATELGHVPEIISNERFNTLQIGLCAEREYLKEKIDLRTKKRIENGMIEEMQNLLSRYDRDFLYSLGFDQSLCIDLIEGKIENIETLTELVALRSLQYAKRQMTWFKRDKRIHWIDIGKGDVLKKAESLVDGFL
ncbi:MAG: tRNA dimethylallyltransferase [Flavobacteriaceae bacterium]|jgi:tRNA dimethylallyltransferase